VPPRLGPARLGPASLGLGPAGLGPASLGLASLTTGRGLRLLLRPASLTLWTRSFLSDRTLKLSFNGNTEYTKLINTGIPQGSPISPILFLIYIRDLFLHLDGIKPLSYIDDIALIAASISLRKTIKLLERAT